MAYSQQAASHFYRVRQFMQSNPGYFTFKPGQGMDWASKRERRVSRRGPWWEKVSLAARRLRFGTGGGGYSRAIKTRKSEKTGRDKTGATAPRTGTPQYKP